MKNKALKTIFGGIIIICVLCTQRDDTKWAIVNQRSLSNFVR